MQTIQRDIVGAVIISSDNKVILGQHIPEDKGVYAGKWVVPGGGIESGESELEALGREMLEEVNIDIQPYTAKKIRVGNGRSKKRLPDSDEVVNVDMVFNDYLVQIDDKTSDEIGTEPTEEFKILRWFASDELVFKQIAEPTLELLRIAKFIKE